MRGVISSKLDYLAFGISIPEDCCCDAVLLRNSTGLHLVFQIQRIAAARSCSLRNEVIRHCFLGVDVGLVRGPQLLFSEERKIVFRIFSLHRSLVSNNDLSCSLMSEVALLCLVCWPRTRTVLFAQV